MRSLAQLRVGRCECSRRTKLIDDAKSPNPRYRGLIHGTTIIVKEEGLSGVYRGLFPVVRSSLYRLLSPSEITTHRRCGKWPTLAFGSPPILSSKCVAARLPPLVADTPGTVRCAEQRSTGSSLTDARHLWYRRSSGRRNRLLYYAS